MIYFTPSKVYAVESTVSLLNRCVERCIRFMKFGVFYTELSGTQREMWKRFLFLDLYAASR